MSGNPLPIPQESKMMRSLPSILLLGLFAAPAHAAEAEQMKLWKEIDIAAYSGTFPCLAAR